MRVTARISFGLGERQGTAGVSKQLQKLPAVG